MNEYNISGEPLPQTGKKYKVPNQFQNPLIINNAVNYFIKPYVFNFPQNDNDIGFTQKEKSKGRLSKLGMPVVCSLTLITNKQTQQTNSLPITGTTAEITNGIVLDDVLITVNQNKKLVITNIQGSANGNVVEYINLDDYKISVAGRLSFNRDRYDDQKVKELFNELNLARPIGVSCWFLEQFDITEIIISDYDFPQAEGQFSTQYFNFNALSYFPKRIKTIIGRNSI